MVLPDVPWFVLIIAAAIFEVMFEIIRKNKLKSVSAFNFESTRSIYTIGVCLLLLPFISFNIDTPTLLILVVLSFMTFIGIYLAALAFQNADISMIMPLDTLRPAFVAILAFIFLGETMTPFQISGIIIILVCAYLLETNSIYIRRSVREKKVHKVRHPFRRFHSPFKEIAKSKYAVFFIIATVLYAVQNIFAKYLVTHKIDFLTFIFFIWIFNGLIFQIALLIKSGPKEMPKAFKITGKSAFICAVLAILINLLIIRSYELAPVSIVTPLLMIQTLFVVIAGGEFFHEKHLLYRVFVSILMLGGAYLVII